MAVVLVIGASRGIGRETVRAALRAGHEVRALSRSRQRPDAEHPNVVQLTGDARDNAVLAEALDGVDAVVQTIGVAPSLQRMLSPVRLFSDATRALIAAMKEKGVERLVTVTGFGAGDSRTFAWA